MRFHYSGYAVSFFFGFFLRKPVRGGQWSSHDIPFQQPQKDRFRFYERGTYASVANESTS